MPAAPVSNHCYYTPVYVRTTNTESVSGVQYFVRSLPPLTGSDGCPVCSPQWEVTNNNAADHGGFEWSIFA